MEGLGRRRQRGCKGAVLFKRNKGALTPEMEVGRKKRKKGWKEERVREEGRRPHGGLVGQLLPQGPDLRDTFILTGRVSPESNEEETGRTNEGQTLTKVEEK